MKHLGPLLLAAAVGTLAGAYGNAHSDEIAAQLRRQYGFGPRFALDAILQIFAVRNEAIEAVERQRGKN